MKYHHNNKGLTMIELLIAMALTGIVSAAIYGVFLSQEKANIMQEQVVDMQQNMRATLNLMAMEIRITGFNTSSNRMSNAGILQAGPHILQFTLDMDNNGDTTGTNEDITYGLHPDDDADANGVADAGIASIRRRAGGTGAAFQPMAEGIQAIRFFYGVDNNFDKIPDRWDSAPNNAEFNNIIAVRIFMLGRTRTRVSDFTDTRSYTLGDATTTGNLTIPAPNDNFRRLLTDITVICRNMSLP